MMPTKGLCTCFHTETEHRPLLYGPGPHANGNNGCFISGCACTTFNHINNEQYIKYANAQREHPWYKDEEQAH